MSRSGYTDDGDYVAVWRGQVASASRGKRGQRFFRDLVAALDAMPEKRLIKNDFTREDGAVCALGALGRHKGIELEDDDSSYHDILGDKFDIASQLAAETMYMNDESREWCGELTPEQRWTKVRDWAARQIIVKPEEIEAIDALSALRDEGGKVG